MLEATGTATTPEDAATIVNTWVAVFLAKTRAALQEATTADVVLVERQYPKTREQLEEKEDAWNSLADEYQERVQNTATEGDRKIAAFKRKTLDLVSELSTTSRLMLESLAEQGIAEVELGLGDSAAEETARLIGRKLHQLAAIRVQMATTLPIVELEKAITDDALWQSLVIEAADETDLTSLESRSLVTQEVNSIYVDLATRAMEIEIDLQQYAHLVPDTLPALLRDLEKVQRQRSASLAKLQADRNLEVNVLRREQNRALSALDRERKTRLIQLRRPVDLYASLERELRQSYSQGLLAKAQENVEGVRLVAEAVPMPQRLKQRLVAKCLATFTLGALLGVAFAVVREVHNRALVARA
jgi:uncharacterized protein involved in exopolysaccharide biosynthesis